MASKMVTITKQNLTIFARCMLMNHRITEIDNLNGMIVKYGKEYGIPTPICEVMTQIVHCIQNNYDRQYKEAT